MRLLTAVVWPMTKHQEVGGMLGVLRPLRAEPVRIKLLWVLIALQGNQVYEHIHAEVEARCFSTLLQRSLP
jgi:hypothetical protein